MTAQSFLAVCLLIFSPYPAANAQTAPGNSSSSKSTASPASPPIAPVRPVTDDYFGTKVVDPYRYMENLKDPKVAAWFKGQNAYTRAVLAKIPGRDALLARIKELDESTPERVSDVRVIPGGRYFYQKRLATENVSKLYMRQGLDGPEKLILDPDKYPSPKGSHNSISYYGPSWDGTFVAVGISAGGSENAVIHILNVDTGAESPETIDRARFGAVNWLPDNHSFFYNRLQKLAPGQPTTEEEEKSIDYLHVVGRDPESDPAVFGFGVSPLVPVAPIDDPFIVVAPGSSYALAFLVHGVLNEVTMYDAPLESVGYPGTPWQKVCDVPDDVTGADIFGDNLYLLTHRDAPKFKVIRTSASHPDVGHAALVVPESEAVITNVSAAQDALYIQETDGMVGLLKQLSYSDGKVTDIPLPFQGALGIAASDQRLPGILLDMTSWARAPRIYSYDPGTGQIADTKLQPLGPNDNPTDITSQEVQVKSWDGVSVPLSIVYKSGLKMDGSNPAWLTGYGAYGISLDPAFNPVLLAWLEKGGVYAVAHPRGGGENGEDWHKWGMKLAKPNTWRDFIACAEYLIDQKFTSSATLGGSGTSAGGITIGRAYTERPDLFAAAIDRVGVSNALRSEFSPNGPPNIPEFGSVKTQWGFEDLYAMDAYLHVRNGVRYPAVLLTTGFNDPRVASWEPAKMTARLQAATASRKPILLRVDYAAGHGIGSTKTQVEEELADEMSFMLWQFGVPGFQPSR
ncbi:MAG: prolyl oligopeptidase family serine peptidase [Candidatus Acidiferrales bacterium]